MRLSACRFSVPLSDHDGQPIDPQVVVELQRELIARHFPDPEQPRAFLGSPEYEELNKLLLRTMKRKGLFTRAVDDKNGRGR